MANSRINPNVDELINKAIQWKEELKKLRLIILECNLKEEVKWGNPCYTFNGKNVVLIHGFKQYCALLFFKGALLNDTNGILVQQTTNVQSGRQIRFSNLQEILDKEKLLKNYILEAIEIEKSGLKVNSTNNPELIIPKELKDKYLETPTLKTAFESLTPGRQRAYIIYFSQPKQSTTRVSRIEKYVSKIISGKGLND